MNLHIVYRTCPAEGKVARPDYYSKRVALESLAVAAQRVAGSVSWTFIGDALDPPVPHDCEARMRELGEVLPAVPRRGDSISYRALIGYCLAQPWDADDIVYLCEDDYLHTEDALTEACAVLAAGMADYATAYDHPDNHRRVEWMDFAARFDAVTCGATRWRPVLTTCLTFATTAAQLHQDAWLHLLVTRAPRAADLDLWHLLNREGTKLAGFFGDAPVVADRFLARHAYRELVARVRDRTRPARRPALLAPLPGLTSHMVIGPAPGRDWAAIARELR